MSKKFEEKDFTKEYQEFVQTDIPDLWDRIEKGLPEKKKKKVVPLKRFALLAACVCLLILTPSILQMQKKAAKNESTAMQENRMEMAAAPAVEDAQIADAQIADAQIEDTQIEDSVGAQENQIVEETLPEIAPQENIAPKVATMQAASGVEEDKARESKSIASDRSMLEEIVVTCTIKEQTKEGSYLADVIKIPKEYEKEFPKGIEVKLWKESEAVTLENGKEYQIRIQILREIDTVKLLIKEIL